MFLQIVVRCGRVVCGEIYRWKRIKIQKKMLNKITDVHILVEEPGKGYEDGIIIELFGNEVYNSVK